jgi:hypothetical protein
VTAEDDVFEIRAHYERFPAALKGAFVLQALGRNPHLVSLGSARLVGIAREGVTEIPLEAITVNVAPRRDVFVPFEVGLADLSGGWYQIEIDIEVDGIAEVRRPGERFSMSWPRGTVRRGPLPTPAETGTVTFDRLDCSGDSLSIEYRATAAVPLRLRIDGAPHPIVSEAFDDEGGRGRIIAYPLLRSAETLEIDVRGVDLLQVSLA